MAPWPPVATMNRNIADAYVDVELLWREGILDTSARGIDGWDGIRCVRLVSVFDGVETGSYYAVAYYNVEFLFICNCNWQMKLRRRRKFAQVEKKYD